MYILRKSAQKLKNKKIRNFSPMTTFYNFALEIETSRAKKYVKASLENWNPVMLLGMLGLFILG